MNDNNYLSRRAAFWDNWKHSLECAIRDFDAQSAGKFIDANDKSYVATVQHLLNQALFNTMERYHSVLGQQLESIGKSEVENNVDLQ